MLHTLLMCSAECLEKTPDFLYGNQRGRNAGVFSLHQREQPSSPGLQEVEGWDSPFPTVTPVSSDSPMQMRSSIYSRCRIPQEEKQPDHSKVCPGYLQWCISRGWQDLANRWVLVTAGMRAEPLAPALTRPYARKLSEQVTNSALRAQQEQVVRLEPVRLWACRQVFLWDSAVNTRGQPIYCTAVHAFIAFVHSPADSVYDAVKH